MHRLLLPPLLLLALSGCSRSNPAYGLCASTLDCANGQGCGAGSCEDRAIPTRVAVDLIPATTIAKRGAPVESQFLLDLGREQELTLSFVSPVRLEGQLLNDADVGASVTISRASQIGGAAFLTAVQAQPAFGGATFAVNLPPTLARTDEECDAEAYPDNDCYRLWIEPTDIGLIPPMEQFIALPAESAIVRREITLPAGSSLLEVTGVIEPKNATSLGASLEVRLVNEHGLTISSVAQTTPPPADSPAGSRDSFLLSVRKDYKGASWLKVSAPADARLGFSTIFYPVAADFGGANGLVVPLPDSGDMVEITYAVTGKSTSGGEEPVEGVLVRFTRQIDETAPVTADSPAGCIKETGCGVFRAEGRAVLDSVSNMAVVTLTLVPNATDYDVDILPGTDSPYSARRETDVAVGKMNGYAAPGRPLDRKLEIAGRLVDDVGQPLLRARVVASMRRDVMLSDEWTRDNPTPGGKATLYLDEGTSEALTDKDGRFLLRAEPGAVYDVVAIPPVGSAAPPWRIVEGQSFDATLRSIFVAQLPQATALRGKVIDWTGAAQPGVTIRLYDGPSTAPWLRGQAVSSPDGSFSLAVGAQ
jgi:hypothetical protein